MAGKTIIPTPTFGGLPSEEEIVRVGLYGQIDVEGPEGTRREQLIDGTRDFFHTGTAALLQSFPESVYGILIAGIKGEGPVFGLQQFKAIVSSHLSQCPQHLVPYVGILGSDEMVAGQIQEAQLLGAQNFVLGLNHTRDKKTRFQEAMFALDGENSLWLYNMPTFKPADLDFIRECMSDSRVKGIKDSSGKLIDFQKLLKLKKERPDFEIYIGSEPIAAELTDEEYAETAGIIAGNANIDPNLLVQYANSPQQCEEGRNRLHAEIHKIGKKIDDEGDSQGNIRNHIHGIKYSASQSVPGVDHRHVVMYSKRGKLFIPYSAAA